MKRIIALLCVVLISLVSIQAKKKKGPREEKKRATFTGVISYYGKVTRIPDKYRTQVRLGDFDSLFDLYLNPTFSRRVEKYDGLEISITEGINQDIYFQYIASKIYKFLVVATPSELRDYQLTPKYVTCAKKKIREVSGRKRINGYKCKKVVCDIVTHDKLRVQLIAWYSPELYIPGYQIPYFGELKGLPLMYDTYNGEYVITYNATGIKKRILLDNFFSRPSGIVPITMDEYLQKMQQIPQE